MNNVLLTGNGFDLAHGLLTNYKDFLFVLKKWKTVRATYKAVREGRYSDDKDPVYKYVINASNMDEKNLEKLDNIINRNSWIKYYCQCEAEIDLWIDFEREIIPVINFMEAVFNSHCITGRSGEKTDAAYIEKNQLATEMIRTLALWDKYFDASGNSITVHAPYASLKYGILKKRILKDLRQEFNEFIDAFEIYLCEFVEKKTDVELLKQIKELKITHVISFNYTLTERLYGVDEENSHHIHGQIRTNLNEGHNNMVVGVNEQKNQNMDFIYFVKYFQRIQKGTGVKYKKFTEIRYKNIFGECQKEPYTLYIYGHSLDETDEDILKYTIGDFDTSGIFQMKPDKLILFYYNEEDYAQKVINLIKLYGRAVVEEYIENGIFEFVEIEK